MERRNCSDRSMLGRLTALMLALLLVLSPAPVVGQEVASVAIEPAQLQVGVGEEATLEVVIRWATNLFGIELQVEFDTALLEVLDDDPAQEGTQASISSSFLRPDTIHGNEVDNDRGYVALGFSQEHPGEPASGDGVVASFRVRGKADGEAVVRITSVVLANADGGRMPVIPRVAVVYVGSAVPAEASATPTTEASPTPTDLPTATTEPTPTETLPTSTATPEQPADASPSEEPSPIAEEWTPEAASTAEGGTWSQSPLARPTGEPGIAPVDESPVRTPTSVAAAAATATPRPTATHTPVKEAMASEETPVPTEVPARVDGAAEPVQSSPLASLWFIAAVVGVLIVGFGLFVVLPRGRRGRA